MRYRETVRATRGRWRAPSLPGLGENRLRGPAARTPGFRGRWHSEIWSRLRLRALTPRKKLAFPVFRIGAQLPACHALNIQLAKPRDGPSLHPIGNAGLAQVEGFRRCGLRLVVGDNVVRCHVTDYRRAVISVNRQAVTAVKHHSGMNFGQRLRRRRKELDLTQQELAALSGIKQGTLSDLERGRTEQPMGGNPDRLV